MSHHSDFSLTVLEAAEIANHFGEPIAKRLLGKQTVAETRNITKKSIGGYTRSDWFKWKIAEVLKQTPYQDLIFLSEEACSHLILTDEDEDIIQESDLIELDEDDEQRDYFTLHYYTVISADKVHDVLEQVNSLLTWSANNIEIIADILEWDEEDIQTALERAGVYQRINDCPFDDEGDSTDFFFCALKSIQDLLSYASTNGLYAIYKNENFDVGLNWLLANKPRMISIS